MDGLIIIVTPESAFGDALELVCSDHGCRVETTATAGVALGLADRMTVYSLIIDASSIGSHVSVELAKTIHKQNPAASCFLIVGNDSADVRTFAEKEPWLQFVQKPLSMLQFSSDVVDAIEKTLEELES
jgi:DNA-binding NtrC family response regulator